MKVRKTPRSCVSLSCQDNKYTCAHEDPFILKCNRNGIKLWSLALDVRTGDGEQGPPQELRDGDQVVFHYTNEQALGINESDESLDCNLTDQLSPGFREDHFHEEPGSLREQIGEELDLWLRSLRGV